MPKFDANISWLFGELPFMERFAAARAAGFECIEIQLPYAHPKNEIRRRLDGEGLTLALHNMPAGDWEKGERGLACLPGRQRDFRDSVTLALDYAAALGAPRVHCMAGLAPAGADARALEDTYVENLRHAGEEAAKLGIEVNIEPINTRDVPGYYLHRTMHAEALLARIARPNVRLQFDVYHVQIMEGDLVARFERLLPLIGHVQIADTPGRNEPGTGEINYPFVLGRIDALGYRGWVGCEYRPRAGTHDGLGWMARWRR
ncbi:MAG: hydroxypyruvate isomerase family protein [Alphaproteobacteria bacterium]|nr:hydroxypyruvate isomerase family protein [Alphaproteobacteria bacterium]